MRSWIQAGVGAFAAMMLVMGGAVSAEAAIIVTEGKTKHDDGRLCVNSDAASRAFRPDASDRGTSGSGSAPTYSKKDPDGPAKARAADKPRHGAGGIGASGGAGGGDLGNLDSPPPDGWSCRDMGGGVEICERTRQASGSSSGGGYGAAPGAGAGGGVGADGSGQFVAHEDELAGCESSGPGAPLAWLAALAGLWASTVRRRRRV